MQVHVINSARSRRDTMLLSVPVPAETGHRLHELAIAEATTVEALLLQAIAMLVGDTDPADGTP